ncbi:MAG: hypothetical protein ACREMY_02110, partial [bacterium]
MRVPTYIRSPANHWWLRRWRCRQTIAPSVSKPPAPIVPPMMIDQSVAPPSDLPPSLGLVVETDVFVGVAAGADVPGVAAVAVSSDPAGGVPLVSGGVDDSPGAGEIPASTVGAATTTPDTRAAPPPTET